MPLLSLFRERLEEFSLPSAVRKVAQLDRRGLPPGDPGPEVIIKAGVKWLYAAQDESQSNDGGVARHFSLIDGWASSYPETTGYIIPTMLASAGLTGEEESRGRTRRMLDWIVSIQFPEGGFQGGTIGQNPRSMVTFNTGQILLGLTAGAAEFGASYSGAMARAANWLVDTQDPDGCWRSHPTPFAAPGRKAYETHVAWGLMEAARYSGEESWSRAALANVDWALRLQRNNGWFDACCLTDARQPLTHTIGYVLRGIVEAHRFSGELVYLDAARSTADALLRVMRSDGSIPGRLDSDWRGTVPWTCLSGNAQIAACWLLLHQATGESAYRDAALAANRMVRRTIIVSGPSYLLGGVKGSFPISGSYGRFQFLNWACKFVIDANLLELGISS